MEMPSDYRAVEELTREAFWNYWEPDINLCQEHYLVHLLRDCPALVPELNCVATLAGNIVGHIIYTKSYVLNQAGERIEMLTFGPLSVLPSMQGKGIGRRLVAYTLDKAKTLGYRAVLILGHPNYYPRLGFRPAKQFGISTANGQNFEAFMAYPLYPGALDGVNGSYHIDAIYEQLKEEDVLEFDRTFPLREAHCPKSITILLEFLSEETTAALAGKGIASLEMMTTLSENEVRQLPGVDENAIITIRRVLKDYTIKW